MTDRSVAEIMGWQRCDCAEGCQWMYPPGADPQADEWGMHETEVTPTPDDMLAWLSQRNERTWSPFWIEPVWGIAGVVRYLVRVVVEGRPAISEEAPTLHAALEAAVRAVGDAT